MYIIVIHAWPLFILNVREPLDFYSFKQLQEKTIRFLDEHQQLMRAAHGEKGYYKEIKSKQHTHTPNIHFLLYILLIFVYLFMPAWWMYRGVNSVYFVGPFVVAVENTCVRRRARARERRAAACLWALPAPGLFVSSFGPLCVRERAQ
jgi:hypothetical protein